MCAWLQLQSRGFVPQTWVLPGRSLEFGLAHRKLPWVKKSLTSPKWHETRGVASAFLELNRREGFNTYIHIISISMPIYNKNNKTICGTIEYVVIHLTTAPGDFQRFWADVRQSFGISQAAELWPW